MKRPTTLAFLALAGIVVVTIVVFFASRKPEPSYQNKTLTEWLAQLDYSHRPQDLQASNAVHQMGTNILPFLRPMLHARDTGFKLAAVKLLSKQHFVKFNFVSADEKRQRASRACRVMGLAATNYLPELVMLLESSNRINAWCGFTAITSVKPVAECVPELTQALTNSYSTIRWDAAEYLGRLGEAAKSATPALLNCLKDPDREVRIGAMVALTKVETNRSIMVSRLSDCLADSSPSVRQRAVLLLGEMGADAGPSKSKLIQLLQDDDLVVRQSAESALAKLGLPTAPADQGVK